METQQDIPYLDLKLGLRDKSISFKPYRKATALKVPLPFNSCHALFQRQWWPVVEAKRYARNSASSTDCAEFVKQLQRDIESTYPEKFVKSVLNPELFWNRRAVEEGLFFEDKRTNNGPKVTFSTRFDPYTKLKIRTTLDKHKHQLEIPVNVFHIRNNNDA